jgi:hypothetical protein
MMPQFILLCRDKPDALALRMATRPAHLEYFHGYGNKLLLAGPMLDAEGKPKGSMIVIEAADEAEAREIAANDPYGKAGLFAKTEIMPFRIVTGSLAPTAS